jgi:hypothetical protein
MVNRLDRHLWRTMPTDDGDRICEQTRNANRDMKRRSPKA